MIVDKDLGEIKLIAHSRAKRVIARIKDNQLHITHPKYITHKMLVKSIEELKPQLIKLLEKNHKPSAFSYEREIYTYGFTVQLIESDLQNIYHQLDSQKLRISIPNSLDISSSETQNKLKQIAEVYMRKEANRLFPEMLRELAKKYDFGCNEIKINKSRGRWGSCSSKKNINLSYFCMFLPAHLIEFVMKHELCHTIEMNHGNKFWQLLDKCSDGKALELTQELKKVKLPW